MKILCKSLAVILAALMLFSAMAVTAAAAAPADGTYYVAGPTELCGDNWKADSEANKMNGEDGVFTKTYTALAAGDYQFKITNGKWSNEEGGADWGNGTSNYKFKVTEACDVTITFNTADESIAVTGDKVETANGIKIESIALVGETDLCGEGWNPAYTANIMTEKDGVWTLTLNNVEAGEYEYKFAANGSWDVNWGASKEEGTDNEALSGEAAFEGDSLTLNFIGDVKDVTFKLDLSKYDPSTKKGATYEVTLSDVAEETTAPQETIATPDEATTAPEETTEAPEDTTAPVEEDTTVPETPVTPGFYVVGSEEVCGVEWWLNPWEEYNEPMKLSADGETYYQVFENVKASAGNETYSGPDIYEFKVIYVLEDGSFVYHPGGMGNTTRVTVAEDGSTILFQFKLRASSPAKDGTDPEAVIATVYGPKDEKPSDFSKVPYPRLDKDEIEILIGEDDVITPYYDSVTAKIEDSSIASIKQSSNGKVTVIGRKEGVTKIAFELKKGDKTEIAYCIVKVKKYNTDDSSQSNPATPDELLIPDDSADNFTYTELDDGTLELTGYTGQGEKITIPSKINGKKVTGIGYGLFQENRNIVSVKIPDSIKYIDSYCFNDCYNLRSVSFGKGLSAIGVGAFENCYNLRSVIIPDSVKSLGYLAFDDCSKLSSVTLSRNLSVIEDNIFNGCSELTEIVIPDSIKEINFSAFSGCTKLKSVSIGKNVSKIDENVFYNCGSIEEIKVDSNNKSFLSENGSLYNKDKTKILRYATGKKEENIRIPESVKRICDGAFSGGDFKTIVIPDTVSSIGRGAFYGCNIESITIPGSVKTIDGEAFGWCYNLESVTISEGVNTIGSFAFYNCWKLNSITLPDSITELGNNAFEYTEFYENDENWSDGILYLGKYLLSAWNFEESSCEIKEGTIGIADNAFYYRYRELLEEVVFPDSLRFIGKNAFSDCYGLWKAEIGSNVTIINDGAFSNCRSLKSVVIPDSVNYLGSEAYKGCGGITNFELGKNIIRINDGTFSGCYGITNIILPKKIDGIGKEAFYESGLESISIPDSVTFIGENAFDRIYSLKNVKIGNGVKKIGNSAFYECYNLEEITMGEGVEYIGANVFGSFENLKKVNISNIAAWFNIEFYDYSSNPVIYSKGLYFNGELLNDIEIPEGVTTIKSYAFSGYDIINSISFPKSLRNVDREAFYKVKGLKKVIVKDLGAWCSIDFGEDGCNPINISHNLYYKDKLVTDLKIPSGVKKLERRAFHGCYSLKSVTISDTVTSIDPYAFYNCINLKTVTIPKSIKKIKGHPFGFSNNKKIKGFKIIGYVGSGAQKYARENAFTFVNIKTGKTVKHDNLMKINSKKSINVKAKIIKKKSVKLSIFEVYNAIGKVKYNLIKSKISKKIRKLIKINSKGVITFKKWKKAKKGMYKINVKISAKGNSMYKSKSVSKTVKIRIK